MENKPTEKSESSSSVTSWWSKTPEKPKVQKARENKVKTPSWEFKIPGFDNVQEEKDKSRHQLQWMTLCRSQLEILLRFLNRSDQTSQLSERKCSISGANLAGSGFF